jgi:hypothetical protein
VPPFAGYLRNSLALIKGREEISAPAPSPANPELKAEESKPQAGPLFEAPKPARATFAVVKKEPPAAMTRALTGLLKKAPRRRVAADEVYERYAAQMRAEGQQPEALAEFLVRARTFCEHLGIETAASSMTEGARATAHFVQVLTRVPALCSGQHSPLWQTRRSESQALACARLGLEGIVAKRKDAPYRSGTRSGWIKVRTPEWKAANKYRAKLFEKS